MKILVIGAHYDDIELSCGGTVAKFIKEGHDVYVNVVTTSDYTSYDSAVLRNISDAQSEGIRGLLTLGIKEENIRNLGLETKKVIFEVSLIENINRSIDTIKPDLVITHHPYAESHQDHVNTAMCVMSASRRCNAIWVWEPYYPSKLSTIPFRPMKYIDVSDYLEVKIRSLKKHKSQWKKYSYWEDLVKSLARLRGIEIQKRYAETFEIVKDNL